MRPFPDEEIASVARENRAMRSSRKDISFGYEGTVATNVKSALSKTGLKFPILNFITQDSEAEVSAAMI